MISWHMKRMIMLESAKCTWPTKVLKTVGKRHFQRKNDIEYMLICWLERSFRIGKRSEFAMCGHEITSDCHPARMFYVYLYLYVNIIKY